MGTYDYLITSTGGNIYEVGTHIPVRMADQYVFEDMFNRADGPVGNGWDDIANYFPEKLQTYDTTGVVSGSVQFSSLSTHLTDCDTYSMGNLTLTGSKSAGTSGNTTQRATTDGWRCVVWKQTDQTQNGIYIVNHSGAWTRATDYDTSGEITQYSWVFGLVPGPFSTFSKLRFVQMTASVNLGTSNIVFNTTSVFGYRPSYVKSGVMNTDPLLLDSERPAGEWTTTAVFRDGLRSDNFEAEVRYIQGSAAPTSTFGSQGSPAVFVDPNATDRLGVLFTDDVGQSGSGSIPMYLSTMQPIGTTGGGNVNGLLWLNFPVPRYANTSENVLTIRVVNGKMAGYMNNVRVCGPMPVPTVFQGRTKYGAWSCNIASALSSAVLSNMQLFRRVTFRYCNKDLGSVPAAVTFPGVGTVTSISGTSTMNIPYPTTQSGDRLLMMVVSTPATGFDSFTTPTGWTASPAAATGGFRTADSSVRFQCWLRNNNATGPESGSVTLSHVTNGTPSNATAYGWIIAVRGANPTAPMFSVGQINSASTSLTAATQSLWTINDTPLWIGAIGSGSSITVPSGFTTIQSVGAGQSLNMTFAYRIMDLDTLNNITTTDDVLGTSGIVGTIGSSVTSIGWSSHIFHDPR